MRRRTFWSLGLSALILGGSVMGCTGSDGARLETAGSRTPKQAEREADYAGKALDKHDAAAAVSHAEAAVTLARGSASYRALLGRSYLQAGRLVSARTSFEDAVSLNAHDGRVALNLALTQIALGDWQAARQTLDRYSQAIPAGDLGLAVALSGDPAGGVTILTQAARSQGADAKVRQNLALALALAGQWNAARIVAAADMSPADVDARLEHWAVFAQPTHAADQVAALLNIHPVQDAGQPAALALNQAPSEGVQVAHQPLPPVTDAPRPVVEQPVANEHVQGTTPAPVEFADENRSSFEEQGEVVQPIPARMVRADRTAASRKQASVRLSHISQTLETDNWYVQIGAYDSLGVARDAWSRAQRRFAFFRRKTPNGMGFSKNGVDFYRLSVGGFAREEAEATCRQYRAQGGACFVRAHAGDRVASWVSGSAVRVATR